MAARRGVIIVFVLIFIGMVMSLGALFVFSLFVGTPPTVPSSSTLYLPVNVPFAEIEGADLVSQLTDRAPTLRETVEAIAKAKRDSRVKALVVMPRSSGALWAQAQEVRAALEDFRQSGKPVTAFLEFGGAQEYYIASAADRVVLMPGGQLDLVGLATYELFFRGTLDKLGVEPNLLHIGEYKTAANTFTERSFTKEHLEMSKSLNRDWYDELVRAIAEGRKKTVEEVRAAIDNGPFLAEAARQAGLVDVLAYEDQLDDEKPIAGTQRLDPGLYAQVSVGESRTPNARIALLYAAGTIASGRSSFDGAFGLTIGSETFVEWLRKVRVDPLVRAVVVRIDSPGGSAVASEVIWREMMLTRDRLPLIVSMGDVAASGGYYMALPAHAIVAQPGTLTGSIGVVTGKFVLNEGLDKIGVGTGSVSDGRYAEIYSPFRAFTPGEKERMEEQMRATYDLFVTRVVDGRKSTRDKIDAVAQGRVWTGRQARERGLVDEVGSLGRAIALAKEKANLDARRAVDLVVYPQQPSLFDLLFNPFGAGAASALQWFLPRPEARAVEQATSLWRRFRRGETLMLMPNVFLR